jgi:hypothetical protein
MVHARVHEHANGFFPFVCFNGEKKTIYCLFILFISAGVILRFSRSILQMGHWPGFSLVTCGCMGQLYVSSLAKSVDDLLLLQAVKMMAEEKRIAIIMRIRFISLMFNREINNSCKRVASF